MSDKSRFISDVKYLGVVQFLNYVVPLFTFPYLTRTLGVSGFGEYSYVIALMAYPLMLISFGFDMSATVTIVSLKGCRYRLNEYVTSIYILKFIFFIVVVIILSILIFLNIIPWEQAQNIAALLPMLFGMVFSSVYIFQAFNLLKHMSLITIFFRLLTIPSIYFLVNSELDIIVALYIQSLSAFLIGITSFIYLNISCKSFLCKTNIRTLKFSFFDSLMIFKTSCASSIYTNSIPLFIGGFYGYELVGVFNVANTIKNIAQNFINVFFRVLFPNISRKVHYGSNEEVENVINKSFLILIGLIFIGCLSNLFISGIVIDILSGDEFESANNILKILMFTVLFSAVNNFYGVQTLIPLGMKDDFGKAVIRASIITMIMIIPTVYFFGAMGGAIASVLSEVVVFIFLYMVHRDNNLKIIRYRKLIKIIKDYCDR